MFSYAHSEETSHIRGISCADLVKGIIDSLDHLHDGLQGVVQLELVLLALERLRQVLRGIASVYWIITLRIAGTSSLP